MLKLLEEVLYMIEAQQVRSFVLPFDGDWRYLNQRHNNTDILIQPKFNRWYKILELMTDAVITQSARLPVCLLAKKQNRVAIE